MLFKNKNFTTSILALNMLILLSVVLYALGLPLQTPAPIVTPDEVISKKTPPSINPSPPKIVLQRLDVTFLGQDGNKLIGSGCPGTDAEGSITNYHFSVKGVDNNRVVTRIVVAGDNSTLTWALPC